MRANHASEDTEPLSLTTVSAAPFSAVLLSVVALWFVALPTPLHAVGFDIFNHCGGPNGPPPVQDVTIDQNGLVVWEGKVLSSHAELEARMRAIGKVPDGQQVEVHLWPQKGASYGTVLKVMATAQRNGVQTLGMISDGEITYVDRPQEIFRE
ncbi:ExbD/TolR family protein [Roseateles sp. L2-2]|uniref:ExbD/TolR family protein n=1 Tax=Roseateles TaxID=93681 RepID=UPI003D36D25E